MICACFYWFIVAFAAFSALSLLLLLCCCSASFCALLTLLRLCCCFRCCFCCCVCFLVGPFAVDSVLLLLLLLLLRLVFIQLLLLLPLFLLLLLLLLCGCCFAVAFFFALLLPSLGPLFAGTALRWDRLHQDPITWTVQGPPSPGTPPSGPAAPGPQPARNQVVSRPHVDTSDISFPPQTTQQQGCVGQSRTRPSGWKSARR